MLNQLAPHARVWVYQSNRFFSPDEDRLIHQRMSEFIPQWASHGNELYGDFGTAGSLFLVVGADEEKSPASGCSIDTLNRYIKAIGDELNIDFFDRLQVAFSGDDGKLRLLPMSDFKARLKTGELTPSTIVFNNLVTTKEELDGNWQTEVRHSWHKNLCDTF